MRLAATRSSISAARSGDDCARTGYAPAISSAATSATHPNACGAAQRRVRSISSSLHHLLHMLDLGRLRKTVPDQLAPFLEIGGAAEIDRVVLDRLPFDEQAITLRTLDRALQLHALAALGAAKERRGRLHAGLEFGFHAGLDVDLRDLEDHIGFPSSNVGWAKAAPNRRLVHGARSAVPTRSDSLYPPARWHPKSGLPDFGSIHWPKSRSEERRVGK